MITITKPAPNRIDMEFEGEGIDEDEMRAALERWIEVSEGVEHGRMLYRLPNFPWPTLSAMGVKLGMLPQLFKLLGNYERCAILTDEGWMRTIAEIEGALIPGLEIKGFPLDQGEAAEAWLEAHKDDDRPAPA